MRTRIYLFGVGAIVVALAAPLYAQVVNQPAVAPQQQAVQQPVVGGIGLGANGAMQSGAGGAASADFDSLIDLIQSTIAVETWAESGGGEAEIRPFPTGVMVDAAGALKLVKASTPSAELAKRRGAAPAVAADSASDPRRTSKLRFVSLPRLEREIIRRQDGHEKFDPTMLTLAGLQRIEFIFVYPPSDETQTGDLVVAGPAGDWRIDPFGRIVSADNGAPVIRLDDLLTLLRRSRESKSSFFGCMINPRQAALAATQTFLDQRAGRPLEPGERKEWLEKIRSTLGRQDVEIFGIDPTSHVARVMVEADVHMKLIGMGIEDGVPGVESYLDSVKAARGPVAAMSVLRWWFALDYAAIRTSPDGNSFQFVGDGACVQSENEALAAQGQRIHTGQSDPLNQQFADSFTAHFNELAAKYPVYGELRAIFDLSLAVALIDADKLMERARWMPTRLLDNEKLRLPRWPAPKEVDTVANCVLVNRRQIIAGVSGGVMVDVKETLANRTAERSTVLANVRDAAPALPDRGEEIQWWWDAKD